MYDAQVAKLLPYWCTALQVVCGVCVSGDLKLKELQTALAPIGGEVIASERSDFVSSQTTT